MKKRVFSILFTIMAVALLAVLFTATAAAETYWYNDRDLEVQTEGDYEFIIVPEDAIPERNKELGVVAGAYITKFTGTLQSSVAIPAKLGGKPVVQIGRESFKENNAIQTVTIGASVRSIDAEAFMDCTGLQTVLISKEVTWLLDGCFENCTALKSVTFEKGSKLKRIEESAFDTCTSLNSFKLPEGTEFIGNCAFYDCDSLTEFTIPDSVTFLGNAAFYASNSLTEVTIGKGVTELKTRETSGENWGISGYNKGTFEGCISLVKVTFGKGLTDIGTDSFAGTALVDVTIPDNVVTIGDGAFMNCPALRKITIGNGVTSMGESILEDCDALKNVTIGSGVVTIGDCAFYDCDSLETILIPSNVADLGNGAFYHCENLKSAVIGNGVKELKTRETGGDNWGSGGYRKGIFEGCVKLSSVRIGSAVHVIGDDCFAGTALVDVTIPDNVITIGDGAFMNCLTLKKIVIGNGVTSMGESIFENCDALTDVTIGSGVVKIGDCAFYDCSALEEIYIPSNVTNLGNGVFYHCENLKTAVIGNGVTELKTRETGGEDWGSSGYRKGIFEGCEKLTSVTLGSGVISIGQDSFAGTQIETLTVPYKVSTLDYGAFYNAEKLKDVYFVGNWASNVGEDLFEGTAEGFKMYYISGRIGYDDLPYNKGTFKPITVTFSNNNDDVFAAPTENQVMSPAGGYVIEPISPTALGYLFDGWYKDAKCTQKWNFTKDKVTRDTTLYAKWNAVDTVVPVRPENVTTSDITGNSITLHWGEVDGATSYNVYVDGKKVNTDKIIDTSYTVENLKPGTTYEFAVTAVNTKGESERSLIVAERTDSHVHTPGKEVRENEVPATCETDGSYESVYFCTECEAEMSRTQKTIPATGHKFENWTVYNDEEHIRYCENDVNHTETAPHEWNKGKVTTEPTCCQKGVKTFTCKVCKAEKTEEIEENPNNHADYETHVENLVPATCTEKGYTGDTVCNGCGKILKKGNDVEAFGHSWSKWEDAGDGQHVRTCSNDDSHVERKAHNWNNGKVTQEATCSREGVKTFTCTTCGAEKNEAIALNPDNHADYETHVENMQPATCTEKGYLGDTVCNECGKIVKKGSDSEATGHSWGEWQDDGEEKHVRVCANDETHVEREDHVWNDGKVTREATTTETGEKTFTCTVCGREKTEEIPVKAEDDEKFMLGDVNGDGKIDSADARLALRRSVMLEDYPEGSREFRACDVNVDGKVEPTDARLILRAGVGLEDYTKWGK